MIEKTAYFREFLDFGYLWFRDNGKEIPKDYRPTRENITLWTQLNRVLPVEFFEQCPMHWLGNFLNREPLSPRTPPLVVIVALEPGRPTKVERRECEVGLFNRFGGVGKHLINDCSNYFGAVYGDGGLPIAGNPFWRKISRITYRAFHANVLVNPQILEWMSGSVVQVDLWPLRSPSHGEFMKHQAKFSSAFNIGRRRAMVRELISAARPDLVLFLGDDVNGL